MRIHQARLNKTSIATAALALLALGLLYGLGACEKSPQGPVPSLAKVYADYFPIGAAVDPQTLVSQRDLILSQVNSFTAENDMKWENIHPRPGNDPSSYDFTAADTIVNFAMSHGIRVRGHNFVWYQQVPSWVFVDGRSPATRAEVLERMKEHIDTLLAHFKGKVYCWDVVNEALSDDPSETWRTNSPWYYYAGADTGHYGMPDYVELAFADARAADPSVKLFYNDYNIESGAKFQHALDLVRRLKAKGLIDGVGIQGHWSIYWPDADTVRNAIDSFAALGVQVQITELDLSVFRYGDLSTLQAPSPDLLQLQAEAYGRLFKVFRDEAKAGKLTGVTFWGIADDHTWLDDFPVAGRKDWPLLFDVQHRPKPAFWAVAKW